MEIASHANAPPYLLRALTAPNNSAGLARSAARYTAPNGPHAAMNHYSSPLVQSQAHTSSSHSIQSQPSSRSSDTTQGTAHSTLFPPPMPSQTAPPGAPPAFNGNDVTANDNIMNSVADASSSLFQICVTLRQRLNGLPGCHEAFMEEEQRADEDTDPVTLLWRTFRRGDPFILLINKMRPNKPLNISADVKTEKRGKMATMTFLGLCKTDLAIPQQELFIVSDLFADDTTGFVKVARVVNKALDVLIDRGLIHRVMPTASDFELAEKVTKRTQRQHIVSELVTTERTYVQHLELLQAFKHMVEQKGVISGDKCHDIFLNLNSLLDFQRRFLIRVEQTNVLPEEEQNWGEIFTMYSGAFKVYEPYIANQAKCERTVVAEFAKLREAGGTLEMRQMVESPAALYGFLMKPFQRLSKYPLLLDDLYKKGDLDEERKADLMLGREAATSVLAATNDAVDREQKIEAVQDLKGRVEDWKGHKVEGFGDLLLHNTYTVLKSEQISSGKDQERQYHIYLFENILLCCKPLDLTKTKNKVSLSKSPPPGKMQPPKLQLKGRIFMQNVTDLVSLAKPGSYTCQIFWKGDPSIENFIIRFPTEEALKKWATAIDQQRRKFRESLSSHSRHSDGSRSGTSATEFSYLQSQPVPENPYKQHGLDDEEEDDDDDAETLAGSMGGWSLTNFSGRPEYSQSRNASSTSLRSRSTTGESSQTPTAAPSSRAQAPRFPPGSLSQQQHPLALRTNNLQHSGQSPSGGANMESYFSPTGESPASSIRTSASSGMYPFPTQQLSQNGYFVDGAGNTRFTAPAMPRPQPNREPSMPSNGYAPPGRAPAQRMHSAQQLPMAPRNRSASSPDIQNGQRAQMRGAQPPVPDMPAPYQHPAHVVNRSQNNSPNLPLGRASPATTRERLYSGVRQDTSPTDNAAAATAAASRVGDPKQSEHYYHTARTITPVSSASSTRSPPAISSASYLPQPSAPSSFAASQQYPDSNGPSQLRVKVHCPSASQVLTLVVPTTITYASLRDRIDAKLQRSTNLTLGDRGPRETQVRLKYLDETDYVSILSDEDVQTAFETWREANGGAVNADAGYGVGGLLGEIELFCQR